MTMQARVGLFGGSFDPIHVGHLLMAQAALEELRLDRIYFIPAAQSPFKPDLKPAPATDRLRLLHLALAGQPHYEIDTQEIVRGGTSYTIDTVQKYKDRFPQAALFYLIGADHICQLPRWRNASKLAELTQFVVVPRPGQIPAEFPAPFKGSVLKGFPFGVSSSEIRLRVKNAQSIENLVKPEVAEAIRNNRLYL